MSQQISQPELKIQSLLRKCEDHKKWKTGGSLEDASLDWDPRLDGIQSEATRQEQSEWTW
jgi:hypothetical protein